MEWIRTDLWEADYVPAQQDTVKQKYWYLKIFWWIGENSEIVLFNIQGGCFFLNIIIHERAIQQTILALNIWLKHNISWLTFTVKHQ